MLGLTFGASIVAAVMGALDLRRPRAWVAGTVLVAPGIFVQQVASQMSDLPVALFVVATLIMLSRTGAGASLLICGLLAGLAAWTKNEGLVLLAIVAPIVLWNAWRYGRVRDVVWWGAGVAPGVAMVAWLKLAIARVPPEYFSEAGSSASLLERVFDPARHDLLSGLLGQFWMRWGGPAAEWALPLVTAGAMIVACTPGGRRARSTVLVAMVMAAAYHVVWLLSPMETGWLIATSFERLLFQLWPSFVLAAFSYDNAA
jgi:4-amino-4-deoxy-L-arabinose transferase-like glycosyltransferase